MCFMALYGQICFYPILPKSNDPPAALSSLQVSVAQYLNPCQIDVDGLLVINAPAVAAAAADL